MSTLGLFPQTIDPAARAGAVIDDTGRYRYRLWREWGDPRDRCLFVMLNPSTADANADDPTIRRCIGFARRWGHGALDVVNLFAWRATDPRELHYPRTERHRRAELIGPDNNGVIAEVARGASRAIVAWGGDHYRSDRPSEVLRLLRAVLADPDGPASRAGNGRPQCLGLVSIGAPRHPLYVRADAVPFAFVGDPYMDRASAPEART